jgi:uncharacterized protein YkwD
LKNRIVALAAGVASAATLAVMASPPVASADLPSGQVCQAQKNARASEQEQEQALRCLIDHVRARSGVRRLSANKALARAAGSKARDIARCGFTHTACGRPADAWAKHYGYDSAASWGWGENLAAGPRRMTARRTVKSWLNSPPHRATMLRGSYEDVGVALQRSGGHAYWVLEVGCHGC